MSIRQPGGVQSFYNPPATDATAKQPPAPAYATKNDQLLDLSLKVMKRLFFGGKYRPTYKEMAEISVGIASTLLEATQPTMPGILVEPDYVGTPTEPF